MDRGPERSQPTMVSTDGRREFACFPAAILAFIVNRSDEILLLSHPNKGGWQVVAGAIEDGESPVTALRREVAEEVGPDVRVKPVGSVHTFLYRYDTDVPAMLSIAYVATYLSGDIVPGSDMATSAGEVGECGRDRERRADARRPESTMAVPARARGAQAVS